MKSGTYNVSIRSRRLSAGECHTHCRIDPRCRFQSAPADCRRENIRAAGRPRWTSGFNPLPPTVGGRIFCPVSPRSALVVSIRSRRLSAGEFVERGHQRHPQAVSIRSRRLSAGESVTAIAGLAEGTFQSAPADCRRENHRQDVRQDSLGVFQSAPADCRRENPSTGMRVPRR